MPCKGICIHHKASGRYANGHKRCQICDLFIKWHGVFCPCCGSRLRIGPRNIEDKAKLRKQKAKNKKSIMFMSTVSRKSLYDKDEICMDNKEKIVYL
ncbi:MAG: hypothetical protein ACJ71J_10810 [Nitrososphaeraceae archaeon]